MQLSRILRPVAIVAAALALLAVSQSTALADDQRDFDITNESTQPMTSVWVSASASTEWGSAVNPAEVPPGAVLHITFPFEAPGVCLCDLHIAYADGRPDELDNLDICSVVTIRVQETKIIFE